MREEREREREERHTKRKETKRSRKERKKKVKQEEIKKVKSLVFVLYLFNSLDSNFSPVVGVSIIVVAVIKHFGSVGDFFLFFCFLNHRVSRAG